MNPTQSDLHVSAPLTNVSVAYLHSEDVFVADKVFPNIPVQFKAGIYYEYSQGDFLRDEAQKRAPATETAGGGFKVTQSTYSTDVWGFHKDVDDQVRANADSIFNLDADATRYVTEKLMIRREKAWAAEYFAGGVWGYDYDGVSGSPGTDEVRQWSDYTNSDPLNDVAAAMDYIHLRTGRRPNTLVIGVEVWTALKNHPDIVDRIKYSGGVSSDRPARVTTQAVAELMEIDRILVMGAVENTAKEGQTASYSFIGGKKALLVYAAPMASVMTPSAGYTFSWSGYVGATNRGIRIKKFRIEKEASDRIEGEMAMDMKLVGANLGAFWDTIVA